MFQYIESPYPYYQSPKKSSSSSSLKIIAIVIIVMLVVSGGLFLLLPPGGLAPQPEQEVRVAVIDSGIDVDFTLQNRMGPQQSFILPLYGYEATESSVEDSSPNDIPHGTIVAKTVAANSPNAVIVNAKVLASSGVATAAAVIAAIYWALEQNCSVINLSLGATPAYGDPIEEAVKYAFDQGVIVVAAGGNEGDEGLSGNTINSPGLFEGVLAVGALNELGAPADYSSYGPTADRYMKPDIVARGYFETSGSRYYGTSFASPRVAAAAAELIAYSITNEIAYTAGSIITALLLGADELSYPAYIVGAGELDLEASKLLISSTSTDGGLPAISYALPTSLPIDFETLFYGDNYTFSIQLFTSGLDTFDVDITSDNPSIYEIASEVLINQTGRIPLSIHIPSTGSSEYSASILFSSEDFGASTVEIDFTVTDPVARVAFDISFTTWWMDTTYGQFRDFYSILTDNGISVTEIRNETVTTLSYLHLFDAVILLDPFVWDDNETDPLQYQTFSLPFAPETKQAYQDYYESGGGIFVAALSNASLDVGKLNDFMDWSGYSFSFTLIANGNDPVEVTQISAHAITLGVGSFDYLGSQVNQPIGAATLGRYGGNVVLSALQGAGGGRLVVTGTNYFIDNWGINGDYESTYDDLLALRVVQWISGII
ncbi:MAG: S8 family serine peptidase [Candidatus Thorarchaeota archaeon]